MDYIENIAKQAQQLTMYDIKSYYNQAKNAVLNVSEMEAKVREATNDDPWGASSTLMQQIADGTHNFQNFNEIMPCIYARFMEKEAREWRQIYKALTLLEFLVKNGSERVVDDARAHVSTIKMLRSFHYVDEKGKDQGINGKSSSSASFGWIYPSCLNVLRGRRCTYANAAVRNRSQEIAALLVDVEKIRTERRKARSNKNKYQGQGNDAAGGLSFTTGNGGRYGGFGSETIGGASADGGGSGGFDDYPGRAVRSARDRDTQSREQTRDRERDARHTGQETEYDEYEGADDFDHNGPPRRASPAVAGAAARRASKPQPPPKAKKEEKKKEVDLFDFGDDEPVSTAGGSGNGNVAAVNILGGDDDFDDFQTAPAAIPTTTAPARPANANIFDLLNSTSTVPTPTPTSVQSFSQPPAYAPQTAANFGMMAPTSRPNYTAPTQAAPSAAASKPKPSGAMAFDDLWTTSLSTVSSAPAVGTGAQGKKSLNEMGQQKSADQLWGTSGVGKANAGGAGQYGGGKTGGDLDDLLL